MRGGFSFAHPLVLSPNSFFITALQRGVLEMRFSLLKTNLG